MNAVRSTLALCATLAIAACSGGSSVPAGSPRSANVQKGTAVFRIKVPKKRVTQAGRKPRYISPATQSVVIAIGGPTPVNETLVLTPGSPGCTSSLASTVCTISNAFTPGTYSASITAYDNAVPASGKALSVATAVAFSIAKGKANDVAVTLSGVPAKLVVVPGSEFSLTNVSGGIDLLGTGSHTLLAEALDADGNVIAGPGAPTFAVSQTSGSLVVSLTAPTTANPNAFTVTPPAAYSASTAAIGVTASFAGQPTNGCAQAGAVCSASVTVGMHELVAALEYSEVDIFEAGQNEPLATISAGISHPSAVAFAPNGNIVVANCLSGCGNGSSIDLLSIYTPPYTGLPVTLTTGIVSPRVLTFDAAGDLFVAECYSCNIGGTDNVTEYAAPVSGSSSPIASFPGVSNPSAMAFDSLGNLWVANRNNSSITEFSPPFSSTSLAVTTVKSSVNNPNAIAFDASNRLFVANNNNSVTVYPSPYSSVTAKIISGVSAVNSIGLDGSGNLFASNGGSGKITEYSPQYTNLSAPVLSLSNGIDNPDYLLVDAAGTLFVSNANNGTITQYASPYTSSPITLNLSQGADQLTILP